MSTATTKSAPENAGIIAKLQSIQIGGSSNAQIKRADMVNMLRNLTTLVSNGVLLNQALETLAVDKTLRKHRRILKTLSDSVKTGDTLSSAMKRYPESFPELMIHQIRIGERSGKLIEALTRVTKQIEEASTLRSFIIKKLTYPAILCIAGVGSVTFMILCVIPTFQKMYAESGATLPAITELMMTIGDIAANQGWMIAIGIAATTAGTIAAFKKPQSRLWIDEHLLKLPMLGDFFRNIAVLQFIDVLGNLMSSGFSLAEALQPASAAVNNRFLRSRLQGLHGAIRRGERFSLAISKEEALFPPVVKQLVVVGERTGRLAEVTEEIQTHLNRDVQRYTSAMVGAIEPVLTATLACVVGGILLAVYLPMFDMIGQTNH